MSTEQEKMASEVNESVGKKWDWPRPDDYNDISPTPVPLSTPSTTNVSCDSDCQDGYSYHEPTQTIEHSVEVKTWFGNTAFEWDVDVEWAYPSCVTDLHFIPQGVCQIDKTIRSSTDFAWSYDGVVNNDLSPSSPDEEFNWYIKSKFTGPNLKGLGASANPMVKFKGDEHGNGEILDSDNGV